MKNRLYFLILLPLLLIATVTLGQITVNTNQTPLQLAQALVGNSSVTISNVSMNCATNARGTFNCVSCNMGLQSGIVLTTGSAANVGGPNNFMSYNNNTPGDTSLNHFLPSSIPTKDACVLQFDIQVTGDSVQFQYVFGSEEYPNYTCSEFNDIFAVLMTGPGISGEKNMHLIPGTDLPVSINTVNKGTPSTSYSANGCVSLGYSNYYIANTPETQPNNSQISYDGFTQVMTATFKNLHVNQTYHVKIAIADAYDSQWDSGIFIKANSFSSTNSGNDAPYAVTDNINILQANSVSVVLKANDNDPDPVGDSICVSQVWGSPYITYSNQCDGAITYQADSAFVGKDTAYYLLCDNGIPVKCDTGMILIKVSPNPVLYPIAIDDVLAILQAHDTVVNVTANDMTGSTGNSFCLHSVYGSSHFSMLSCDSIKYEADSTFTGHDTAAYVICDNGITTLCDTAYIMFAVVMNNALYPIAVNDSITILQARDTIINVTANDTLADTGNSFCITSIIGSTQFSIADCNHISFVPDALYTGVDTAYYVICDNSLNSLCDTAMLTVTVLVDESILPIAHNDNITILQPADSMINVTANDTNGSVGNAVCITAIMGSSNFSISGCNNILFNADSTFIGNDTVTYIICDTAIASLCDTAILTVTVNSCSPSVSFAYTCPIGDGEDGCYFESILIPNIQNADSIEWHILKFNNQFDTTVIGYDTLHISMYSNGDVIVPWGGTYSICITAFSSCSQSSFCDTIDLYWTNINEIALSNIKLYPSPTTSTVTIDMSNNQDAITNNYSAIEVYNLLGEKQVSYTGGSKVASLNIADLAAGMYTATIVGSNGERRTLGRFVKE